MAPQKRTAAAMSTAAKGARKSLSGATICFTGTLSKPRSQLEKIVKANGGAVAKSVTAKLTHLIASDDEMGTTKYQAAEAKGLPIVREAWLDACLEEGELVDPKKWQIGAEAEDEEEEENEESGEEEEDDDLELDKETVIDFICPKRDGERPLPGGMLRWDLWDGFKVFFATATQLAEIEEKNDRDVIAKNPLYHAFVSLQTGSRQPALTSQTQIIVLHEDCPPARVKEVWDHDSTGPLWGPTGVRTAVVVPEYISDCCQQGKILDPFPYHPHCYEPHALSKSSDDSEATTTTTTTTTTCTDTQGDPSLGPYFTRLDYRQLLPLIFGYLPPEQLAFIRLVSKAFNLYSYQEDRVWRTMFMKQYGEKVYGRVKNPVRYAPNEVYDPNEEEGRSWEDREERNPLEWDEPKTPEDVLEHFRSLHPEITSFRALFQLRRSLADADFTTCRFTANFDSSQSLATNLYKLTPPLPKPARKAPKRTSGKESLPMDTPRCALPEYLLRAEQAHPHGIVFGCDIDGDIEEMNGTKDAILFLRRFSDLECVHQLVVGPYWSEMYDAQDPGKMLEVLLHPGVIRRLRNLRSLFFGDIPDQCAMVSDIQLGDVAPLLRAYPNLQHLKLQGCANLELRPLYSTTLQTLTIVSGGMRETVLKQIVYSNLPALHRLVLYLGTDYYGGDWLLSDLERLLSEHGVHQFPNLRYLGLMDSDRTNEVCRLLPASRLMRQITSLDLSHGTLSDLGARELIKMAEWDSIRELFLHHNYLSDAMIAKLRSAFPRSVCIDVSDRDCKDTDEQTSEPGDRFVSVAE